MTDDRSELKKAGISSSFEKNSVFPELLEGLVNKRRKGNIEKENKMTRRSIKEYFCIICRYPIIKKIHNYC